MARILITGTLAYDDIGAFGTPLQPDTRNVKLNRLQQSFGGCAMNVAFNLALAGHAATPFVYVGDDYAPRYRAHVRRAGILEDGVQTLAGTPCARAIILTGADGAQFTAFYPGPDVGSRLARDLAAWLHGRTFDAAVIAPDRPHNMRCCARRLPEVRLRVWCPGQYAELLTRDEILSLADATNLLVANRHEWESLCRQVQPHSLLQRADRVIVTDGAAPVRVLPQELRVHVPAHPSGFQDPTGCGDAFVAGVVGSLLADADVVVAVRAGIALAARCLGHPGAQNHAAAKP